jgi:collagenase-like PrtC family protease
VATGYGTWKLDGLFTPGDSFVEVTSLYHQARQAILAGTWDEQQGQALFAKLAAIHPQPRKLDTGFYHLDPTKIK